MDFAVKIKAVGLKSPVSQGCVRSMGGPEGMLKSKCPEVCRAAGEADPGTALVILILILEINGLA